MEKKAGEIQVGDWVNLFPYGHHTVWEQVVNIMPLKDGLAIVVHGKAGEHAHRAQRDEEIEVRDAQ